MITFQYHINRSFLDTPDHPVTIPVEHHYRLREEGAVSRNDRIGTRHVATVVLPDGRRYNGHILYGEAGGRFYYQVKVATEGSIPVRRLFLKEPKLHVLISRNQQETLVFLLDSKSHSQIQKFTTTPGSEAEALVIEELEKIASNYSPFI